jgi:hypothetical protein
MSTDPDDDLSVSLQQLATQTSAAAGTLRRRVTSTDFTTPTPGTTRISLASQKAPSAAEPSPRAVTPVPPGATRISLSGGARSRPSPSLPSAAAASPWAQKERDASLHASQTLPMRVPGALAAMTAVTTTQGVQTTRHLPFKPPAARPSPPTIAQATIPSTALAVRAPVLQTAGVTTAVAASYACSLVLLAATWTASRDAMGLAAVSWIGAVILGLVLRFVWLHRMWRALPAADRVDGDGDAVTPAGAVGRHFIPFYNLYWVFAARAIVCRALKNAAGSAGVPREPPRVAAALASVADIIPCVNFVAGPLFNIAFMARADTILERIRKAQTQTP